MELVANVELTTHQCEWHSSVARAEDHAEDIHKLPERCARVQVSIADSGKSYEGQPGRAQHVRDNSEERILNENTFAGRQPFRHL